MMKKVLAAIMTAAMAAALSIGAAAGEDGKIEAGGLVFEIPEEYKSLLTVQTEDLSPDTLITVSETASIEAAEADGQNIPGPGWLFSISRIPEDELKRLRCGSMDGMEVFARDDSGIYYVYNHPTDVRFVREQYEDIDEDLKQWGELNDWAFGTVREEVLKDNPQLEKKTFGNTSLDMFLARAAFEEGIHYEIRSLYFGTLDPTVNGENDNLKDLIEGVSYETIYDLSPEETPDGEYIVLAFDDDGVQFDFFLGEGMENYIRQVTYLDNDETSEILYKAVFEDPEKTSTGIMKEWAASMTQAG